MTPTATKNDMGDVATLTSTSPSTLNVSSIAEQDDVQVVVVVGGDVPPEESNKTANHVYILHPEHAWIPAQVVERPTPTSAVVSVPLYSQQQAIVCDGGRTARKWDKLTIQLEDYPNHALPLQNVDGQGTLQVVEDMVDLPFLHEVSSRRTMPMTR